MECSVDIVGIDADMMRKYEKYQEKPKKTDSDESRVIVEIGAG